MQRILHAILISLIALAAPGCDRQPEARIPQESTVSQGDFVVSLLVTPTEVAPSEPMTATVSYRNASQDTTLSIELGAYGRYTVTATSSTGTVVFDSQTEHRNSIPSWVNYSAPLYARRLVLPPGEAEVSSVVFAIATSGLYTVTASLEGTPSLTTPPIVVTVR